MEIPVFYQPDPDPAPPCECPWAIDFRLTLPHELQRQFLTDIAQSFQLLNQAVHSDRIVAIGLREQAVDAFGRAAALLDNEPIDAIDVGWAHLDDHVFQPGDDNEHAIAAGTNLLAGLNYAAQRLNSPATWRAVSLKQLNATYTTLSWGNAGFSIELRCFTYRDPETGVYRHICVPILIPEWINPDDVCLICGPSIDLTDHLALPFEIRGEYLRRLAESLALIDQAAQWPAWTSPWLQLREMAAYEFGEAAALLEGAGVDLTEVGLSDLAAGTFEPDHTGWLQEAGMYLADGLTQVSDEIANGGSWEETALDHLDQAHHWLSHENQG